MNNRVTITETHFKRLDKFAMAFNYLAGVFTTLSKFDKLDFKGAELGNILHECYKKYGITEDPETGALDIMEVTDEHNEKLADN